MENIFENQIFTGLSFNEDSTKLDEGVLATVKGSSFFSDGYSRNGRFYPKALWENALKHNETKTKIDRGLMFGCIGHPKDYSLDELLESGKVSHKVTDITIDKKTGEGIAEYAILDTPSGRILNTILRSGSEMYVSTRAFGGFSNETKKKDGKEYKVLDEKNFVLESIDFVIDPGFLQTNPKLVESISEDLKLLSEDKAHIQCENGICQLGEDLQKMNEDKADEVDEVDMFEGIMDLPKEDIVSMLRNIVAENELLSNAKEVQDVEESEASDVEEDEVNEVEDTDDGSSVNSKEAGDLAVDAKLLSNYLSYIELLTKLVRYNEEYEKYYDDLIEFLDKDDKISTADMEEIKGICEEIVKQKDVDESIIVICEKIINLTEKVTADGEEDAEKDDKESDEVATEESFVEFMLTLTERGSDLLSQQMEVNRGLKSQVEHLKFASTKLAESIADPEIIVETVEVEKIVEKEVMVTPKEITEKLIQQNSTISTLTEELTTSNESVKDLEKTIEDLTENLEDQAENSVLDSNELSRQLEFMTELSEDIGTKLESSKELLVEKNSKIQALTETISTKENELSETRVKLLAVTYRVSSSVVEDAISKHSKDDKIIEYIQKESKKLRRSSPVVETVPEYSPNKRTKDKASYLEGLKKG